jgi:conserved domain protein
MEGYNNNGQGEYNWKVIEERLIEKQRRKIGDRAIHAMRGFEDSSEKVLGEIQSKSEIFQDELSDKKADENNYFDFNHFFDKGEIDFNQFFDEGEIKPEFGNLEQILELNEQEKILLTKLAEFSRWKFIGAAQSAKRIDRQIESSKILLDMAGENNLKSGENSTRNPMTDHLRNKISELKEKRKTLEESSPEAFVALKGLEILENVAEVRNGEMVKTPYVLRNLERVERNMNSGRPTFIHGHLGGGKTELAINAAKNVSISNAAREDALYRFENWSKQSENSGATSQDRINALGKFYAQAEQNLRRDLNNGEKDAVERFAPLIISGSKDLNSQDLYADKSLKLTKFNGKSLLEYKSDLDAEFEKWKKQHEDELSGIESEEERQAIEKDAANKILELFKLKHQAFGTEVETIKKELYRGVIEGRPVIIDEVNAIPSAVLISLNDILQRRPGQSCYIPGVGATKIEPGFSITLTGNLSSDIVDYGGTNDLNPAFLSRLDIFEYDYLPQSTEDTNWNDQKSPERNELFRVMISYLADEKGTLQLPEHDKSLSKLFKLAQLSRVTQDVFSNKWVESHTHKTASGDEIEPRLEKSVLSVRNILSVLKEWDKGSEKDLDMALWDGFISNITNPDDQSFILSQAKRFNFFKDEDGWDIKLKPIGSSLTSLEEARKDEYIHELKPMDIMTLTETVEAVYGARPERIEFPDINENDILEALNDTVEQLEDFEKINEFQEKLDILKKDAKLMEALLNAANKKGMCEVEVDSAGEQQ